MHTLSPLVGTALYGVAPLASLHAHAGHGQGDTSAHAHEAPSSPDKACYGDCPCCTVGEKVFVAVRLDAPRLLPSCLNEKLSPTRYEPLQEYDPKFYVSPRSPPAFS